MIKLSSEITCKAFHFWIGILVLTLLTQMVSIVSKSRSKLLASAFFLSMPVTATIMGWAWNDLLFTFFVMLCLFYLVQYELAKEKPDRNLNLILAGVMAGLASWTKYTFLMFFPALTVFYLIGIWRWKWELKKFVLLLIPFIAISSFWIIKNWIFTGNPVYPFLNQIFESPYWTSTADRYFRGSLTRYEIPNWNWKTYLLFPFLITLKPRVMDVHTGILPLVFLPLLFFRNPSRGVSMLKMFLLSYILVWLFFQTYVRSLLPAFAVLFCIGSVVIPEYISASARIRAAGVTMIAASTMAALCITIVSANYLFQPIPYFIGIESKAQYLTKHAASQHSYDFLNKMPGVHRTLLVGLHNPYYLNRPYFFSSCCDPPIAEVLSIDTNSSTEFAFKLKRLGVSHVVWNQEAYERENVTGLYSWNSTKRKMFETFLSQDCRPIAHFGADQILELK
jgi:hypothetical protein